jgi:hypothetical protein
MFGEAQRTTSKLIEEQSAEEQSTKTVLFRFIEMSGYQMDVWYSSPYPQEYKCLPKLY